MGVRVGDGDVDTVCGHFLMCSSCCLPQNSASLINSSWVFMGKTFSATLQRQLQWCRRSRRADGNSRSIDCIPEKFPASSNTSSYPANASCIAVARFHRAHEINNAEDAGHLEVVRWDCRNEYKMGSTYTYSTAGGTFPYMLHKMYTCRFLGMLPYVPSS